MRSVHTILAITNFAWTGEDAVKNSQRGKGERSQQHG